MLKQFTLSKFSTNKVIKRLNTTNNNYTLYFYRDIDGNIYCDIDKNNEPLQYGKKVVLEMDILYNIQNRDIFIIPTAANESVTNVSWANIEDIEFIYLY